MINSIKKFITYLYTKIISIEEETTPHENPNNVIDEITTNQELLQFINDEKHSNDTALIILECDPEDSNNVNIYRNNEKKPVSKVNITILNIKGDLVVNKKEVKVGDIKNSSAIVIGNEDISNSIIDSFKETGNDQLAQTFQNALNAIKSDMTIDAELKKKYSEMLNNIGEEAKKESPNNNLLEQLIKGFSELVKDIPAIYSTLKTFANLLGIPLP